MEENRRFSWSDLFIKVIIVILFVLFTVWLLSLSNKGLSNSLDVLTDNIFSANVEKMKNVGKEYFTTERLPKKIGDIETLTLEEMYEKKLILEIKDKNGNACDAEDSYVSIEKLENEYQMKVNLECGEEEDYIIVIMGCYDYCDTDICEKKEETEIKEIEYQYKKTTGGKWTDYGSWSEWSKVAVTNNNYRQVETKTVKEEYVYDKVVTDTLYEEISATCPEGYTKSNNKCVKTITNYEEAEPTCPSKDGYTVTRNGFTCTYTKTVIKTAAPIACPDRTSDGWTFTGRSGLTCNYSKKVTSSTEYTRTYVKTTTGSYVPADTKTYDYVQIDADYVYQCNDSCSFKWIYTYKVYKKDYKTSTTTSTKTTSCPTNYEYTNGTCVYNKEEKTTDTAICPEGYTTSGNKCVKETTSYDYKDIVKTCPKDYKFTSDNTKCYKDVTTTEKVTGIKDVTYYRYRVREYIGGTTDYKWSKSKEDKSLLNAGYKLTGKTR